MLKELECLLKNNQIVIEKGLSEEEIKSIQELYEIRFPKSLADLLREGLPVSEGFYNLIS